VVEYALNLVGLKRLVVNFVESLGPLTYEHVVEYSERAQWFFYDFTYEQSVGIVV
jgi:hypothetical protein